MVTSDFLVIPEALFRAALSAATERSWIETVLPQCAGAFVAAAGVILANLLLVRGNERTTKELTISNRNQTEKLVAQYREDTSRTIKLQLYTQWNIAFLRSISDLQSCGGSAIRIANHESKAIQAYRQNLKEDDSKTIIPEAFGRMSQALAAFDAAVAAAKLLVEGGTPEGSESGLAQQLEAGQTDWAKVVMNCINLLEANVKKSDQEEDVVASRTWLDERLSAHDTAATGLRNSVREYSRERRQSAVGDTEIVP